MNFRTYSNSELATAAEFGRSFDFRQGARREMVRRAMRTPPKDAPKDQVNKVDYDMGYTDGFDDAKEKYAL